MLFRSDDAAVFLTRARKDSRSVDESDYRNVESIAESDESCSFVGSIDVKAACKDVWLVADDADRSAVDYARQCRTLKLIFVDCRFIPNSLTSEGWNVDVQRVWWTLGIPFNP